MHPLLRRYHQSRTTRSPPPRQSARRLRVLMHALERRSRCLRRRLLLPRKPRGQRCSAGRTSHAKRGHLTPHRRLRLLPRVAPLRPPLLLLPPRLLPLLLRLALRPGPWLSLLPVGAPRAPVARVPPSGTRFSRRCIRRRPRSWRRSPQPRSLPTAPSRRGCGTRSRRRPTRCGPPTGAQTPSGCAQCWARAAPALTASPRSFSSRRSLRCTRRATSPRSSRWLPRRAAVRRRRPSTPCVTCSCTRCCRPAAASSPLRRARSQRQGSAPRTSSGGSSKTRCAPPMPPFAASSPRTSPTRCRTSSSPRCAPCRSCWRVRPRRRPRCWGR